MTAINALKRIGGGRGKGKSGSGSSSDSSKDSTKIRTADKGRSTRDLLNARQARQGSATGQPSLTSPNIPTNADPSDAQSLEQRRLEADEENNNFGDSQERDTLARNAYQPTSPNYTAQQYADVLRNVGYDDDTINEIIRTDPRYANNLNQPQSSQQPPQQQLPTRQHIDHSAPPEPDIP